MFFRIVGLSDNRQPTRAQEALSEREAIVAQGIPLTQDARSLSTMHYMCTAHHFLSRPTCRSPTRSEASTLDRLVIAQDAGSAMVGPFARIFFGAPETARGKSLVTSIIQATSPCWSLVKLILLRRGRECRFRRGSRKYLPRPRLEGGQPNPQWPCPRIRCNPSVSYLIARRAKPASVG